MGLGSACSTDRNTSISTRTVRSDNIKLQTSAQERLCTLHTIRRQYTAFSLRPSRAMMLPTVVGMAH